MAQLVKLQDYISRYQIDLARYPTQFVRLKKSQWERTLIDWQKGDLMPTWEHVEDDVEEKKPRFSLLRKFFKSKNAESIQEEQVIEDVEKDERFVESVTEDMEEQRLTSDFEMTITYTPKSEVELKRVFLDQFFHFQMKWASSTLLEKSYIDPKFMRDSFLRTLLQGMPDSFLVFYYPILKLKKAPIELDIVVMTPTEILIIKLLEQEQQAVFVADGERFWTKKIGTIDKKILNPLIDLNRSEAIVQKLLVEAEVEMPVRKVLLSRNGYIDYPGSVYGTQMIDKRNFSEWYKALKRSPSPMKHMQIKAAQAILQFAETTSFQRDVWQTEEEQDEQSK